MKGIIKNSFIILPVLLLNLSCVRKTEQEPPVHVLTQVDRTVITPHLQDSIVPGRNVLYCSTFQIAWNTLQDEIIKDTIRLEGNPPMARALNKRLSTKNDLSEESYVAMADSLTENFLRRINQALKMKFGNEAPEEVTEKSAPNSFLAYAFLYKNLAFAKAFDRLKEPIRFIAGTETTNVKGFGISINGSDRHRSELWQQVGLVDIRDYDDFIIRLVSKSEKDEIILAKVKPQSTLLETYTAVDQRIKSAGRPLPNTAKLEIPACNFKVQQHFKELEGKLLLNKGWENHYVGKAIQWIRFKLDEKGVVLKSEAKLLLYPTGLSPRSIPLIFDKPFLIYLKQKDGKYPYFAMWVDNSELMTKAK